MPRKSAAQLSVVPADSVQRPEPPPELTREQAAEWRAVVGVMPAAWFSRDTHPLLTAYCRHLVNARRLAAVTDRLDPKVLDTTDGLERFDKLTRMQDREHRAMSSLATRMRLTHQARYRGERKVERRTAPPPWEKNSIG